MTAGYSAGSVWWGLINFGDGTGERNKFFVLLNDISDDQDHFVAALTTSQGKRYPGETTAACGCPAASCYRLEEGEEGFEFTTWIQYDNTIPFVRADLDDRRETATGGFLRMLSADKIRAVLNCGVKSQDLPLRDVERIKKTLKAMKPKSAAAQPEKKPTTAPPPIDLLRDEFERHNGACRQDFYDLVRPFSETEVAQILSSSKAAPANFMETATEAIGLIRAECRCRAAGKKS